MFPFRGQTWPILLFLGTHLDLPHFQRCERHPFFLDMKRGGYLAIPFVEGFPESSFPIFFLDMEDFFPRRVSLAFFSSSGDLHLPLEEGSFHRILGFSSFFGNETILVSEDASFPRRWTSAFPQ